jgi:hypothetical protein
LPSPSLRELSFSLSLSRSLARARQHWVVAVGGWGRKKRRKKRRGRRKEIKLEVVERVGE